LKFGRPNQFLPGTERVTVREANGGEGWRPDAALREDSNPLRQRFALPPPRKRGGIDFLVAAIACLVAPNAIAQDTADQWERGSDPVTVTSGLHHIASDTYITCSPQGGFVRVSVAATRDHPVTLSSGAVEARVFEGTLTDGRIHGFTNADDPLYAAVIANRELTIDGKSLGFSDKDFRYFSLLMRSCKVPS